jgi:hypothetical protein
MLPFDIRYSLFDILRFLQALETAAAGCRRQMLRHE